MITFWLVVSINIANGGWQVMEDVKQDDLVSCLSAVADRVQKAESSSLRNGNDGHHSNAEYEIAVTCNVHHAQKDPV
jgi:hypothetical protein